MLTIPIQLGIGAPKEHQRVIRKLIYHLSDLYIKRGIPYEPFPETMIDESQTSPTPDILLYDEQKRKFVVIIEISATQGFKKDFLKIKELCQAYEVQEGFVYDYLSLQWKRYTLQSDETKAISYSIVINQDLGRFVKYLCLGYSIENLKELNLSPYLRKRSPKSQIQNSIFSRFS